MTPLANSAADDALAAFARGEISAEIALMRLLLALGSAPLVLAHLRSAGQSELLKVVRTHGEGFARTGALVEAGLAAEHRSVASIREQFDAAVRLAPEASVALYSLGSAATLNRTTAEIVARDLVRDPLPAASACSGLRRRRFGSGDPGLGAACRTRHRDRRVAGDDRRGEAALPRCCQSRLRGLQRHQPG